MFLAAQTLIFYSVFESFLSIEQYIFLRCTTGYSFRVWHEYISLLGKLGTHAYLAMSARLSLHVERKCAKKVQM